MFNNVLFPEFFNESDREKSRAKIKYSNVMSHGVWANLVKTRDGFTCIHVAEQNEYRNHSNMKVEAHHIIPKMYGGTNFLGNGITLCQACHKAMHPEIENEKFFGGWLNLFWKSLTKFYIKIHSIFDKNIIYKEILYFLTNTRKFKPGQLQIIKEIVEKRKNVFVVMPTGFGKSILYQIPGVLNYDSMSLVISPLRALQRDQVIKLQKKWIPTTYINSDLGKQEKLDRIKRVLKKQYKFVFLHPKQLLKRDRKTKTVDIRIDNPLSMARFDFLVVDEAHVVKSYGESGFVPEYFHLGKIKAMYGNPQLILLTATASKKTRERIIESMDLNSDEIEEFVHFFKRDNIELEIAKYPIGKIEDNFYWWRWKYIYDQYKNLNEGKMVVFCTTKKEVDELYEMFKETIGEDSVGKFHSEMENASKERLMRLWAIDSKNMKDKSIKIPKMMIATSAFGMGVDIPDIRLIIHYSMPMSLTDYYQQFGRAGRDGKLAKAILLSSSNLDYDFKIINFLYEMQANGLSEDERKFFQAEWEDEVKSLKEYIKAENKWQYILDYFGEEKLNRTFNWKKLIAAIIIILLIMLLF